MNAVMFFLLIGVVAIAVVIVLFMRYQYGVADMETKITGIWSNRDDTMRVLIYNLNSRVQGEVVWTDSANEKLLGSTIIRDMHLTFFGWSKGTYIDPQTRDQFQMKLRLKNKGKLDLKLMECKDRADCVQRWKLVQ